MKQEYFIGATLLNNQLITMNRYEIQPIPVELEKNRDITVKLIDGNHERYFYNCHIDNTKMRRLRLPYEVMVWIRKTFPFSVAYFSGRKSEQGIWKKSEISAFHEAIKNKDRKMSIPSETLIISWETEGEKAPYLSISEGFKITEENATEYLSGEAIASVLPYIFSSVRHTSIAEPRTNGKKCYVIDQTTDWLSVEQYQETAFSHPGLYLLRRKTEHGYAYYVGKAADIKNRITTNKDKVSHPDEKDEDNKQYDDIACIAINLDDIKNLYGILDESNATSKQNPGVPRGSDTDNVIYALEDIAIHTVAMILKSEGKKLDNRQYRNYTKQWL